VYARAVHLDHQVHEALVVVARDGRVRALHVRSLNVRGDHQVLADRKAENMVGRRQRKAEDSGVVGHDDLLGELEVEEFVLLERRLRLGSFLAYHTAAREEQGDDRCDADNGEDERVLLRRVHDMAEQLRLGAGSVVVVVVVRHDTYAREGHNLSRVPMCRLATGLQQF
jgi:hypothetical protein